MAAVGTVRVGCDIGQRVDPTAIVVIEPQRRDGVTHYLARRVERMPLGTTYPLVADRIAGIVTGLRSRSQTLERRGESFHVEVAIDATGIGLAIGDLLRERGIYPISVLFTGGDKINEQQDQISMGKGWMVGRLQVLLQSGRIHLPMTPDAQALVDELINYEITVNDHANASFNARQGKHDDLVIALGLAVGMERHGSEITAASYLTPPRKLDARGRPYPERRGPYRSK